MDNHEALQIELKLLKGWEAANKEERELTPDEQKYYEAYIAMDNLRIHVLSRKEV